MPPISEPNAPAVFEPAEGGAECVVVGTGKPPIVLSTGARST